jgi:small subunit ribosomal protein S4
MGRYTDASCRRCRREGMKLFLKGQRCYMSKCAIETGRPAPGVHGQRRGRKLSDYGVQLHEKQRLRSQFGMQEGQFRLFFRRALKKRGVTGEQLLQMLESRLDNVVYRLGFAPSRRAARQMVGHSHLTVNGKRADRPSLMLRPGAVVAVKDRPRVRQEITRNVEVAETRPLPVWLARDSKALTGQYVRVPTRDEIAPVVNERLIVELYSK